MAKLLGSPELELPLELLELEELSDPDLLVPPDELAAAEELWWFLETVTPTATPMTMRATSPTSEPMT